jgi:hypothetical protein
MANKMNSIRPFIGSKDFNNSRNFYRDLGFTETSLGPKLSLFRKDTIGFYLQDAFVQDWLDNTMVFIEVDNLDLSYSDLYELNLSEKYPGTRLIPIRNEEWGRECFLIDPAGVLWHFGEFI